MFPRRTLRRREGKGRAQDPTGQSWDPNSDFCGPQALASRNFTTLPLGRGPLFRPPLATGPRANPVTSPSLCRMNGVGESLALRGWEGRNQRGQAPGSCLAERGLSLRFHLERSLSRRACWSRSRARAAQSPPGEGHPEGSLACRPASRVPDNTALPYRAPALQQGSCALTTIRTPSGAREVPPPGCLGGSASERHPPCSATPSKETRKPEPVISLRVHAIPCSRPPLPLLV